MADKLFYFGGKKAYVIPAQNSKDKTRFVELKESKVRCTSIAWRIAVFLTLITPLFFLIVKAVDRIVHKYKLAPLKQKDSSEQPPKTHTLKEKAVLYMSLTGNPTHLGHMAAVATAIDALMKKGMEIDHARISLSDEAYHKNKVIRAKGKKVALPQEAREHLLQEAIKEAAKRNMFRGVKVEYWNDQDQGFADHPDSYKRLTKDLAPLPVYLVAGIDLCHAMGNWAHSVENAIVVSRSSPDNAESKQPPTTKMNRLFVKSIYPEYEGISSSAIQERKAKLEPESIQTYFESVAFPSNP